MDVIELDQGQFFLKKFATELYGRGDDGLLARTVLRIRQCLLRHAAQEIRRHKLAMESHDPAVYKWRI